MAKIWRLKPRRGKKSVLQKKNMVLEKGELIIELPDDGSTGPISAKIGDGSTSYNNLPYAFGREVVRSVTADFASALGVMQAALSGKADSIHTHDDRYYTESEMNTKLSSKSDTSHTHSYASTSHTHDDRYYTESEVNNLFNGFLTTQAFTYNERVTSTDPFTHTFTITKSGYTPIAMTVDVINAPSTGANSSQMQIYGFAISGTTSAYVRLKPWVSSAYIQIVATILYRKNM